MIQQERVQLFNKQAIRNRQFVLYWMQASQRTEYNHPLEYAILRANQLKKPLVVFFGITDKFPEANERHYYFLLQGLNEVQSCLKERDIKMIIWHKSPELGVVELSRNADLVIVDRGYLKIQKEWRRFVAEKIDCPLIQVETDVIVPVEEASSKEEFSAGTLRPKIHRKLNDYLKPLNENRIHVPSHDLKIESLQIDNIDKLISILRIDRSVSKVSDFCGGTSEAKKHLQIFLRNKLDQFPNLRNDPTIDFLSNMSPYLHFGQISPLHIALKILQTESPGIDAYLEELIVRRELSMNFVFYNPNYDLFEALPDWSKKSLRLHKHDRRDYIYTINQFEKAETHDAYWNAAQQEMMITGKMHGYMRMYWGKKILEWSNTPEEAFEIAIYLNNKYELDGRDPNGFTGVAWCLGKHDRAWGERRIFGKVRFMNANGLKRKFDIDKYVERVKKLIK